jgi:glycosyltransferase involved in cell wall biosynthesis
VPPSDSAAGASPEVIGKGTLVVLPTYNERENIEALVTQVLDNAPGANVLVVDDSSPDGTADLVEAMAAGDERVRLLRRPGKAGLGTAYVAGFRHGLAEGYDYVLTMDADFSHHPRHLPSVLAEAAKPGVDMVIGSRYVKGGGVVGWGLHRKLLSFGANTFARTTLRLTPHDCTGAYRCYSRAILERLDFDSVRSHGYSALIELLWHFRRAGHHIHEVPITFADRELGQSKISRSEITRGLTTVLRLRFRRAV